jgi:hypothetical protein
LDSVGILFCPPFGISETCGRGLPLHVKACRRTTYIQTSRPKNQSAPRRLGPHLGRSNTEVPPSFYLLASLQALVPELGSRSGPQLSTRSGIGRSTSEVAFLSRTPFCRLWFVQNKVPVEFFLGDPLIVTNECRPPMGPVGCRRACATCAIGSGPMWSVRSILFDGRAPHPPPFCRFTAAFHLELCNVPVSDAPNSASGRTLIR